MSRRKENCRLYVGNLPPDVRESELEDIFRKYGKIRDIDVKIGKSGTMAYAFVEYYDQRDADDALYARDGYDFAGGRIKVEYSGEPRRTQRDVGPPQRSDYRVIVTGLPHSASWQDLKDHMRSAGRVGYANILAKGTGVVEYDTLDDMEYAIRKLDKTEFKNPFDKVVIRVKEDRGSPIRGRSRSRGRDHSRSRSRSRDKEREKRRRDSRSRSRSKDRKRSPSRSRSPKKEKARDKDRDSRSPVREKDRDERSPRRSVDKEPKKEESNGDSRHDDRPSKRTPSRSRSPASRGRSEDKD